MSRTALAHGTVIVPRYVAVNAESPLGNPEDAWRWLAEMEAGPTFRARIPALNDFLSGRTYAELGDFEASLAALERSVAEHEAGMEQFGLDPVFDPIRDTSRFRALLEKMGLTAYHAKYSKRASPASAAPGA